MILIDFIIRWLRRERNAILLISSGDKGEPRMMRAEISGKNSVKGYQMKSDYEKERFNRGCIDYRKKILFLRTLQFNGFCYTTIWRNERRIALKDGIRMKFSSSDWLLIKILIIRNRRNCRTRSCEIFYINQNRNNRGKKHCTRCGN